MSPPDSATTRHKPLRQLAAEKLHGPGANPSQLGDPISLKAETSSTEPAQTHDGDHDGPARPAAMRTPPPSSGGSHEEKKLRGGHHVRGMLTDEIRRGEVGPPGKSLEGDPISLQAESVAKKAEVGKKGKRGGSKL